MINMITVGFTTVLDFYLSLSSTKVYGSVSELSKRGSVGCGQVSRKSLER
jgi:hypothetical protein